MLVFDQSSIFTENRENRKKITETEITEIVANQIVNIFNVS